jgi:nucleoid-associated protein
MAIQDLNFHTITRWQDDQPAELKLGNQVKGVTADHEALFSQLKKLFQFRAGKFFGKFSEDIGQYPFPSWRKEQQNGKIGFEKLSALYVQQLKELIDKTSESFERHIVHIQEDRADGARSYIFLLENSSGMKLDSQHTLEPLDYLNTSKLELAVRIDLEDWNSDANDTPYLTLVKGRTLAKLGEAFAQSVGFENIVDTKKETETLMEVLAGYTRDAEPKDAANIKQKAYNFCVEQQQLGEAVPITELSGYLDENQPTRFAEFAEQEAQIENSKSLRPDTRKLKHLVRLSGKGNGLSLSFSSDLFQQTILFDEQTDTLTITAIPKTLKKQLMEYMKDKD